jgi:hypothetical protein
MTCLEAIPEAYCERQQGGCGKLGSMERFPRPVCSISTNPALDTTYHPSFERGGSTGMRSYETLGGLSVRGEDRILAMITHPSHRHG